MNGVNEWNRKERDSLEAEVVRLRAENYELKKRVQSAIETSKAVNIGHLSARGAIYNTLTGQNVGPFDFSERFFKGGLWV